MFYSLFLLFFSLLFSSVSHPTVVTENDPATLVEAVSVITGDFYLGERITQYGQNELEEITKWPGQGDGTRRAQRRARKL